jgi:thioester reductase-like protein
VAAKIESMRESQEEQENKFEDMLEAMGMDYDEMDEEDERNIRIVRDDKDSPEYGNSYTDWSPNLDDYLT